MESSLLIHRLPEAHSLPDGFFESSAEPPRALNFTAQSSATDRPPADGSFPEQETLACSGDKGPKDYKEMEQSTQLQDGVFIGFPPNDSQHDCQNSQQQETEGCKDLFTLDTKEKLSVHTECLRNQKLMETLIEELQKENEFLKGKCEKSDITLVKLVEEREVMKKQLEKLTNQKERLESLCRALQAERKQSSIGSSGTQSDSVSVQTEVG